MIDHHDVGAPRHEHAARGHLNREVVRPAFPFDIELVELEGLRAPNARRQNAHCKKDGKGIQNLARGYNAAMPAAIGARLPSEHR
jgi:hypothetical protein